MTIGRGLGSGRVLRWEVFLLLRYVVGIVVGSIYLYSIEMGDGEVAILLARRM